MSTLGQDLARQTFSAATQGGTQMLPPSMQPWQQFLEREPAIERHVDLELTGRAFSAEFPLWEFVRTDVAPDVAFKEKWQDAVRWILKSLQDWHSDDSQSLGYLRFLLAAAHLLDLRSEGLKTVAAAIFSNELETGLLRLIERAAIRPHRLMQRYSSDLAKELGPLVERGEYERVGYLIRHLELAPCFDVYAAVALLWQCAPSTLASAVISKDDVLFSKLVCEVLEDDAVGFAQHVQSVSFKYVCVSLFNQAHSNSASASWADEALQKIFLQVAQTADWSGWMRSFFKYLDNESPLCFALTKVLKDLEPTQWKDFLSALSLGHRNAEALAKILAAFAIEVDSFKARPMWGAAFEIWNAWDYERDDPQHCMFAPLASGLDFPVVMYYANLPVHELNALQSSLMRDEAKLEECWFDSLTTLISERNRLLSKLRLIKHAKAVVLGNSEQMPPAVGDGIDGYARIRYMYYDVHA